MAIYNANAKGKLFQGAVKVKKAYLGSRKVYSSGNIVTYHVDSGVSYQEEVDEGASCLNPTTFTPAKSGWVFVGWGQDTTASSSVLSSLTMGDNPITLYAVFRVEVTLSFNGNGSTSGSVASQGKYRYYNNGNTVNPTFTVPANGYSKSGYSFVQWRFGSASGTAYSPGASLQMASNTTLYAEWKLTPVPSTITNQSNNWTCTWTKLSGTNCGGVGAKPAYVGCSKDDDTKSASCILQSSVIPTNGCTKLVFGNMNVFTEGTITVRGQNGTNLGNASSGKTINVSGYSGIYFYCNFYSDPYNQGPGWQPHGGISLQA